MRKEYGYFREGNTDPKFSVVICTYNDAEYLSNATESVINQSKCNWELIIVNDGSSDDTLKILEPLKIFPNIHVISLPQNKGKAFCLNIGLQAAKGTWLVELDADDWLPKKALEMLDNIVCEGVEAYYGNYVEWRENYSNKQLSFSRVIKGMPDFNATMYLESAFPLAPRIYRMDTLRKIGGWYTKDIFESRMYEDVYILCAISKKGRLEHLDELLYHRRLRSRSVSAKGRKDLFEKWKEWVKEELSI
ncbi:glycosyltransferase family 2 protein [Sutcliffiella horikoshii]|nr:glycosyltransferase family 2 protein [Sutcliffiella horikoshii]